MKLPIKYSEADWKTRREARLAYVEVQGGKCAYCGCPLDGLPDAEIDATPINEILFPKNFFEHPIHLHHDHETDWTIGAVHARCNAYLWQYLGE